MTVLVVGSEAIIQNLNLSELPWRRSGDDIDIIADYDSGIEWIKANGYTASIIPVDHGKKVIATDHIDNIAELEIAWPGTTAAALLENYAEGKTHIASNDVVFMLKHSHKYLKNSPHFQKTRLDIQELAKLNCGIPLKLFEWYTAREKETYDYSHPVLAQGSATFFDASTVKYVYDHDSIHRAVAIGLTPAYLSYVKDGAEVQCSIHKWLRLPHEIKMRGVIEEAMVLAIERSLVPHPSVMTPREAFLFALEKVCTSITSGWFRAFAYNHYDEAADNMPVDYFEKFNYALSTGWLQPYK